MYHYPRRVENYTTPFLWMVGVLLFMVFWTIASVAGFFWVVISATGIELGLRALGTRRR
ncbi:hypothetical protein [Salibaculum halophilum]|uniref:hypothetical protein n=1 Tax=Salibaculum halophilum TaxID=1914408 RepID=UPI0015C4AAED|nr:hypothetical protein [Salibaculum halophilum]